MGVVLFEKPGVARPPARSLVVTSRMPEAATVRTGTGAFDADGDVVVECDVVDERGRRCGWGCAGPRSDVREAVAQHRRMFHAEESQPYVVLINHPRG